MNCGHAQRVGYFVSPPPTVCHRPAALAAATDNSVETGCRRAGFLFVGRSGLFIAQSFFGIETSRRGRTRALLSAETSRGRTVGRFLSAEAFSASAETFRDHTETLSACTETSRGHTVERSLFTETFGHHTEKSFLYAGKSSGDLNLGEKHAENGRNCGFCRSPHQN
jgi:hypothetical protein